MAEKHEPCEKVIRLETEMDLLKEQIERIDQSGSRALNSMNTTLIQIGTILDYQVKASDKRDQVVEQLSCTLAEISRITEKQNVSLEKLNEKIDKTDKRLAELDQKFMDDKNKQAAKKEKEDSKWTIHFADIFQKVFWLAIGAGAAKLITVVFELLSKE